MSNNTRIQYEPSEGARGRPETPPPTPVGEDNIPPLWKSPNKVECFYPKGYKHPPKTTLQSTAEPYHPSLDFTSPHFFPPSNGNSPSQRPEALSGNVGTFQSTWVNGESDSVENIYNTIIFSQRPGLQASNFDIGIDGDARPFSRPLQSTSTQFMTFAEFQARFSGYSKQADSRHSTPDSDSSGESRNLSPGKSSLPLHRIRCFRYKGTVVWDKELRVDKVRGMYRLFRESEHFPAAPITLPPPIMGKVNVPVYKSHNSQMNSSVGSSPADTPMLRSFRQPEGARPTLSKSYLMSSIHNNGELVGVHRPEGPSKKDCSSGVSIATYNVFFELYDTTGQRHSADRINIILKELESIDTDVIALQEVTPYFYSAFRKSATLRKCYYWTTLPKMVNEDVDQLAYSQVVLSKFPIVDACLLKLSRHKRCLLTMIYLGPDVHNKRSGAGRRVENELMLVANCHLSSDYGQSLGGHLFKRQAELSAIYNAVSSTERVSDFNYIPDVTDRMMSSSASMYSNGTVGGVPLSIDSAPVHYLTTLLSDRAVPPYIGSLLVPGWTNENILKGSPSTPGSRIGIATTPPLMYCQLQRSKELKADEGPGAPPTQSFPAVILGDFNCEDSIGGISPCQMLSEFKDAFDVIGNATNQFTYDNMRNIWVEDYCGRQRFDRILMRGVKCDKLALFGERLQWVPVQFVEEDVALAHRIYSQIEKDGAGDTYYFHLAKRSVEEANLAALSPELSTQIYLLLQASDHFGLRCNLTLVGVEDDPGSPFQRARTSPFLLPEAMS